jgi:DNA-binding transcriptional LysR family regulator
LKRRWDSRCLDRSARQITLTAPGEQLLSYGRRLLSLSDEVFARFTDQAYEGELVLGVPADIVYPHIPQVLQRFAAEYPRVRVLLQSSCTSELKRAIRPGRGRCDPDHRGPLRPRAARRWRDASSCGSARRAAPRGRSARCRLPSSGTASFAPVSSGRWTRPA